QLRPDGFAPDLPPPPDLAADQGTPPDLTNTTPAPDLAGGSIDQMSTSDDLTAASPDLVMAAPDLTAAPPDLTSFDVQPPQFCFMGNCSPGLMCCSGICIDTASDV